MRFLSANLENRIRLFISKTHANLKVWWVVSVRRNKHGLFCEDCGVLNRCWAKHLFISRFYLDVIYRCHVCRMRCVVRWNSKGWNGKDRLRSDGSKI